MKKIKLVKSTSGVRGIIGTDGLEPVLASKYAAAFGSMLGKGKVVVGRDSRPSGEVILPAVKAGLASVGIDVVELGVVPTPTVEIAVTELKASGGVCITASHNPSEWNALKFFNDKGEFITPAQYKRLNTIFESGEFAFRSFDKLGRFSKEDDWAQRHVLRTLEVPTVNVQRIKERGFTVVVDAVNGAGSFALPHLLEKLGARVIRINCKGDGDFTHQPEPIPENLTELCRKVKEHGADLGLACDPDADRLAIVDENGLPVGEELTLAMAVKAVLRKAKGPTVINLSTSKVTEEIAKSNGSKVFYSKVGEANVVQLMHKTGGIIGGEGNGGVIYPGFHAGRDSLIAAALVLTLLAEENTTVRTLVETFPEYYIRKTKGQLDDRNEFNKKLKKFETYTSKLLGRCRIDRKDGLRFDFSNGWLQLRSSNTEPIYRLIVETNEQRLTDLLVKQVKKYFK